MRRSVVARPGRTGGVIGRQGHSIRRMSRNTWVRNFEAGEHLGSDRNKGAFYKTDAQEYLGP